MSQTMPQELRDIWTDAYKLHARHEQMPSTVEAWTACAADAQIFCSKHGQHPLAVELAIAVYNYLDKCRKEAANASE